MRPGGPLTLTRKRVKRIVRAPGRRASLGLVIALVAAMLMGIFSQRAWLTQATPMAPVKSSFATAISGAAYGASQASVQNAVNAAAWPQQNKLWCGIATVAAIAKFKNVATASQQSMADYLNSPAATSAWGTPGPAAGYYGPGFSADISRDFGSDPRSLAQALAGTTNQPYHQMVDLSSAYEASASLAADVVRSGEPISVFVDHALHSVLVSAVFATGDPIANPGSITGFQVWDPAWSVANTGIQPDEVDNVPLSVWLNNSAYWGQAYSTNWISGYIYDPDPAVGPYAFDPTVLTRQTNLWSGHYVYIRPDAAGSAMAGVSADWAENQNGALIKGWDGQIPTGYTGLTSLFESVKVTLPETSPYGIAFAARGSYDATAAGSAPAAALAWTGTDALHHLNVLTSQDGLNYANKLTLVDTSFNNPAVLIAPPATAGGSNVVVIAWIGTDGGHSLNVMYDVYGQRLKLTLWNNSSANTPGLAWFQGQVWLAWTGTNAAHSMNIIPLGPQGVVAGTQVTLWTQPGASTAPQLDVDSANNRMLLSWSRLWSNQVMVLASSDNVTWSAPSTGAINNVTSYGSPDILALPAPAAGIAPIYLAWTTTWSQIYLWRGSNSQGWTSVQAIPETSPYGTEVGYLGQGGAFVLAWSGTDALHHLNVALILM